MEQLLPATPGEMAADTAAILTPREVSHKIFEGAAQLAEYEKRIEQLERELRGVRDDRNKLARETLPTLFDHIHTDHLGVPGWEADVVLESRIHAAIKAEMPEEEREVAFAHLETLEGGGDIVKHTVSVQFSLREAEQAAQLVRHLRGLNWLGGHEVRVAKEAHWATLTSFVKKRLAAKKPVNIGLLGGTMTRECSIKWRKSK